MRWLNINKLDKTTGSRSQWPRGLRRRSATARLLRLWVPIPPEAWMSCLLWLLCVVRYRSLRRAEHSSREVLPTVLRRCVWSRNLVNEEDLAHRGGCCAKRRRRKQLGKNYSSCITIRNQPNVGWTFSDDAEVLPEFLHRHDDKLRWRHLTENPCFHLQGQGDYRTSQRTKSLVFSYIPFVYTSPASLILDLITFTVYTGTCHSAVGWGTALQVRRSRVRFPMSLWPWDRLSF